MLQRLQGGAQPSVAPESKKAIAASSQAPSACTYIASRGYKACLPGNAASPPYLRQKSTLLLMRRLKRAIMSSSTARPARPAALSSDRSTPWYVPSSNMFTKDRCSSCTGKSFVSSPKGFSNSTAVAFKPLYPVTNKNASTGVRITLSVKSARAKGNTTTMPDRAILVSCEKGNGKGTATIFAAWLNPRVPVESSWRTLVSTGDGVRILPA
mmetsp:Transcript_24571/g.62561  ORF Transcript_24571/g.62561 Transcript_24571/m.62561 type:complete len:211 (+) Transcript_24571:584-1216(+)